MALTTEDLGKIKAVVNEAVDASELRMTRKIDSAVGELALAAQNQFVAIDARFDGIDTRLDGIDTRLDGIDARLGEIEDDMVVVKDMVKDHGFRITKLEHRQS